MPLAMPAVATTAIFTFIWTWNDFFSQLLFLTDPDLYTVPVALRSFVDATSRTPWVPVFAISVVSVPLILDRGTDTMMAIFSSVRALFANPGTVLVWEPAREDGVRYDSGVESGSEIGIEFDPMIAKVIAHAPTRREAAARLARALERTRIQGIVHNRDFLVVAAGLGCGP